MTMLSMKITGKSTDQLKFPNERVKEKTINTSLFVSYWFLTSVFFLIKKQKQLCRNKVVIIM